MALKELASQPQADVAIVDCRPTVSITTNFSGKLNFLVQSLDFKCLVLKHS